MNTTTVRRRLDDEARRWQAVKDAVLGTDPTGSDEPAWIGEFDRSGHHPADLASETAEREFDFGLLAEADQMLDEVVEARGRLDAGTYGSCQSCGVRIPAARLDVVPATRFCIAHERAIEPTWAGGAIGRPTTAASRRMRA